MGRVLRVPVALQFAKFRSMGIWGEVTTLADQRTVTEMGRHLCCDLADPCVPHQANVRSGSKAGVLRYFDAQRPPSGALKEARRSSADA